ncbi:MAG: hypothetical protein JKY29_11915 [Gammaproteobacteria bacterium]|nr:hypothetical protein [Gammaproteobacteria bacterium]
MHELLEQKNTTTTIVYLLLFVLLALRMGGAVSHYCFDGQEPPVSIHFDNLSGHVEHTEEAGHTDTEKQVLSDNLVSKIFDIDSLLIIVSLFLLCLLPLPKAQARYQYVDRKISSLKNYLPPLRAPPLAS